MIAQFGWTLVGGAGLWLVIIGTAMTVRNLAVLLQLLVAWRRGRKES